MIDEPGAGTKWVAALEQLPPDARGARRTLRLHAVAAQAELSAPRAACGYVYLPDELRLNRAWASVTPTGRCALCDLRLRRAVDAGIDLLASIELTERIEPGSRGARTRLSVVPAEPGHDGGVERRSPDRP